MDIMTGLSALNSAIDIAKKLNSVDDAIEKAELRLKLAELIGYLADAKVMLVQAKEEISARDGELSRMRDTLKVRAETVVVRSHHYRKNAEGQPVGRPFCPRCMEADGKMISMQHKAGMGSMYVHCPQCKIDIQAPTYAER